MVSAYSYTIDPTMQSPEFETARFVGIVLLVISVGISLYQLFGRLYAPPQWLNLAVQHVGKLRMMIILDTGMISLYVIDAIISMNALIRNRGNMATDFNFK